MPPECAGVFHLASGLALGAECTSTADCAKAASPADGEVRCFGINNPACRLFVQGKEGDACTQTFSNAVDNVTRVVECREADSLACSGPTKTYTCIEYGKPGSSSSLPQTVLDSGGVCDHAY